uniref:Reverse transcriptase domain-containing protein n=1 Tax=Tanacetum cinerariifolium TaxID=118510 RepID=A0A6L2JMQ5_TANCI|nr:reverse transcriptase domain-containing protein [Tanacetum cinerariifolium]
MRTRSSSNLPVESSPNPSTSNPKRCNRRRSKQPFILEESPDLVSKFINEFFPPSRTTNLRNEISNYQQQFDESFHEAWDRYKYLLRACPHHGFTELHQLDTFYNALNPADQDSLNSTAGGNLLERRTQDVLTIIENKSKVHNSRNKSIVSQIKSSDANSSSSSVIAKLTHAVNQQTSAVTTAMTAILKQFQATPPPAFVKAVEEICVACGGAHPYYQCLAAGGNTFSKLRDNIQGYVSAVAVNYNQGSGHLPSNTIANPKGDLKAITTRSGIVLDGTSIPTPPPFINPEEDERVEETLTDQDLVEYTIKKMLKALISNKEKLLELANTPLNENCSAVIFKKLPEKLGDPGKFLIPCGFSELKCKALSDLDNLEEPRVHVPNVLTTHPTLMLDTDFIPSDNSLPEYKIFYFDIEEKNSGSTTIRADISLPNLESFNFNSEPDPGELTSIVNSGIRKNDLSTTNVNLPPEEDYFALFAYVVWIFLSFLMYPVVPLNLLSFRNEDTIFDPGISNYHFSSLLPDVSHRFETFMKSNVYPKLLNESPMEIMSSPCSPMEQ